MTRYTSIGSDDERQPLLSTASSSGAGAQSGGARFEKRVYCKTPGNNHATIHIEAPTTCRHGLRLAGLLRSKSLNENTELDGALKYWEQLGKCTSTNEKLCRVTTMLTGRTCKYHSIMELAERISKVESFSVVDYDPVTKKYSGAIQWRKVESGESWEDLQAALDALMDA